MLTGQQWEVSLLVKTGFVKIKRFTETILSTFSFSQCALGIGVVNPAIPAGQLCWVLPGRGNSRTLGQLKLPWDKR